MSWADYTKLVLQGDAKKANNIAHAGLFGNNGAIWDQDSSFGVTTDEVNAIVTGMKDNSKFQSGGIVAGGVKYMFTSKTLEDIVVGRKSTTSIMLMNSKQGVVIAVTKEGVSPGNVTMVKFVVDDLVKKGY